MSTHDESVSIDKYTIVLNNNQYSFELILKENILQLRFGLQIEADKYKNNFSLEKLIHKENKLSFFYLNIRNLKDDLCEMIKNNAYEVKIFEDLNFSKITFPFQKFKNNKLNFTLELFLYKTDSKYASTLVNKLNSELESIENNRTDLKSKQEDVFKKLRELREANTNTIINIDILFNKEKNQINDFINDLSESSELKLNSLENSVMKIKTDLINYGTNLKFVNQQVYLPILRTEDKKMLKKWFAKEYDLILAFNSIKHGDSALIFHEKCSGKVQTLVLIETESGRRFGGYTKLTWDSTEDYKGNDDSAFIFSLDRQIQLKIKNEMTNKAIYCSKSNGPRFGNHDIVISDEFTKNNNSYSSVFNTYGNKEDIVDSVNSTTLLAGIEFFTIVRMEVYQVIFK